MESNNGKESTTTQINKAIAAENDLIEKGLVNVFFDVNSATPNQGSANNLYIILHYMQNNPTAKVKLFGFADKRGDEALNKNLSMQRAQNVYDFLIANAIDVSRVSIEGIGADTKFMDNSEASLTLARRVSVAIEINTNN
jgi:OOP family OmpA-OmpF porin